MLEYLFKLQGQLPAGVTPPFGADATGVGCVGSPHGRHQQATATAALCVACQCFATDYPLPSCPELLLARLRPKAWLEARREKNVFDRQVRIFAALGWEPTSAPFERIRARRA